MFSEYFKGYGLYKRSFNEIILQEICSTEIRTVAGRWNIKKGCQQKRACENNRLQVCFYITYHSNYQGVI